MSCVSKRRGRYVLDFYDQHGIRRIKRLPKGTTKKQAEEELGVIRQQIGKGVYMAPGKAPMFTKVAQDWLEYKKPKVRSTTWDVCEGHVRNHFTEWEELKIDRITTAVVEKFITARQQKGMNINTLRKVLVTLGQILSYAVRHRYLDHNPLKEAERPRDLRQEKEEGIALTPEQVRAFIDSIEDQKYKTLLLLAVMSGARQGELLGLKWSDLDLENNQLHIQRTFNHGQFFPPKSKASNRKIDLAPIVVRDLRKWKLACPKTSQDLMFPNEVGNPINCRNLVQRHFIPALEKAGIIQLEVVIKKSRTSKKKKHIKKIKGPRVRFHDLRHTFGSLLLEQGETIKYIQTQLGHSTPMTTLNVYLHNTKGANQTAVRKLENTIFEKNGNNLVAAQKKELTETG
jgi:integrase